MDARQFRDYIFIPAFESMGPPFDSPAARQEVLLTILHESDGLQYIRQRPHGPALGLCQMEPATYNDCWRYLREPRAHPVLRMVRRVNGIGATRPVMQRLYWDARYAITMCRVRYWMVPEPLPAAGDRDGLVLYWSRYFQTTNDPAKEAQIAARWDENEALLLAA